MTSLQPQPPRRGRRREGNITFIETTFETRVRMMIAFVARREAREIVKRKLKAQGVKLSLTSAMTITQLANAHLRAHSEELLREAEASGAVQRLRQSEGDLARQASHVLPNAADGASWPAAER